MNKTILIADDDPDIVELLKLFLERESYTIMEAYDGKTAWECIRRNTIDLIIIDIMMPELDGFQLLKLLRTEYRLPVIILSSKSEDSDKILGLRLGADDYIEKPFNPLEVVARVQAQLRRAYEFGDEDAAAPAQYSFGDLLLDEHACVLYRRGEQIALTSIEFKLLRMFMSSPDRIFTKKQLFEQVWSDDYWDDGNTVMVHISRLRDKMEDNPRQPRYIKTIRGLGYKFAKTGDFIEKKS
ncbi:response regulator transcription factor [Paenibacillus sp. GCM10027626]|uniref:response regulator transcription factor n=1 Tax=Paenibacillus sp. GCM10027626 TaxID=3273411 RepID=UPI0036252C9D